MRSIVLLMLAGGCAPTVEGAPPAVTDEPCAPAGERLCYCTDGEQRGTQWCAGGALGACECDAPSGPLCDALQGVTECAALTFQSEQLPASILFVVDRSGSMGCNAPPLQDTASCDALAGPLDETAWTKWQIVEGALRQVFGELVAQGSTAAVGLSFFSNDNFCGVNSTPAVAVMPLGAAQQQLLGAAFDDADPAGGTPLVGATLLAYAHLHQEVADGPGCTEPCGAPGNRFVVVITDGADSCPTPSRPEDISACAAAGSCTGLLLDVEAPKAVESNILTFVIGAPGSEPARGYLSELAWVGQTGHPGCIHDRDSPDGDCHFDMTRTTDFAADIAAALQEISGAALGCEFAVPDTGAELDPDEINVQYTPGGGGTPVCFAKDDSGPCDSVDGWQFAQHSDGTDDLSRVVLCGSACDAIRADAAARVDVILGCGVIVN